MTVPFMLAILIRTSPQVVFTLCHFRASVCRRSSRRLTPSVVVSVKIIWVNRAASSGLARAHADAKGCRLGKDQLG